MKLSILASLLTSHGYFMCPFNFIIFTNHFRALIVATMKSDHINWFTMKVLAHEWFQHIQKWFNMRKSPIILRFYHKSQTRWLHHWTVDMSLHQCVTWVWAVGFLCARSTPRDGHPIRSEVHAHWILCMHTFNVLSSAALIIFQLSACKCLQQCMCMYKFCVYTD